MRGHSHRRRQGWLLGTAVTVALAAGLLTTPATAAPKIGAPCTQRNKVLTINGQRAKCARATSGPSKGKWLWKRVSATPAPAPDGSIDIHAVPVYRVVGGNLERRSGVEYFSTDSRKLHQLDLVRSDLLRAIAVRKSVPGHPRITLDYWISPHFPQDLREHTVQEIERSAEFWNDAFREPVTIRVTLATEKDLDHLRNEAEVADGLSESIERFNTLRPGVDRSWITGSAGYRTQNGKTQGFIGLGAASWSISSRMNPEWPQVAAHEFVHVVQQYLAHGLRASNRDQFTEAFPEHLLEGSANTLGYALAFRSPGWVSDALDNHVWQRFRDAEAWRTLTNANEVPDLLIATEDWKPQPAFELSYAIGALLWEWVIAKYGIDTYLQLISELKNHASFGATVQAVLGISKQTLYQQASDYIFSTVQRTR